MKHIDGRWLRWATPMDSEPDRKTPVTAGSGHSGERAARTAREVSGSELTRHIESTALAFRGYDVANLGRSRELLDHERHGPVVARNLEHVSEICSDVIHARANIADHIRAGEKTSLETFPHDIATIVAMELAQLELLGELFAIPIRRTRLTFGYSIGELSALIFGGSFTLESLLPVP